ncbi:hypothetical protein, partial [Kingella kingae]|uniref:hypothetical protein n=1 Tax=Kingella kingae TaxID=504 RepID=UPI001E300A07
FKEYLLRLESFALSLTLSHSRGNWVAEHSHIVGKIIIFQAALILILGQHAKFPPILQSFGA